MDKLRAMDIFVRIVESGSLSGAAESLDTSLASVVRSLAALEKHLGTRLLQRTTRRMALTDEGREYLERCRRVLAEVADAEAVLSARQESPAGRLVITAPVLFGRLHVGPVLIEFLRTHSAVQGELILLDRVVDLLEEGMDLAVRISHLADSSLVAVPLGSTRRVLCASPEYLARHGTPRQPADLADHRAIHFSVMTSGTEWAFHHTGKSVRVPIAAGYVTNQVATALDACVAGLGCGRFLGYQCRDLIDQGLLVPLLEDFQPPSLPVQLVYPTSRLLSPRVRAFVDWAAPRLRARLANA